MKANELRIGNIVSINNKEQHPKLIGVPLRVTSIHQSIGLNGEISHGVCLEEVERKTNQFYGYWNQLIQFIEPLRISEELLLKCGFEITANDETDIMMKHVNDYRLQVDIGKGGDKKVSVYFCNTWMPHIKYLHQLQNLYFALNGEELEIKL